MNNDTKTISLEELERRLDRCNFTSNPPYFPLVSCDEYTLAVEQKLKKLLCEQEDVIRSKTSQQPALAKVAQERAHLVQMARDYLAIVFNLIGINAHQDPEADKELRLMLYALIQLEKVFNYCPDPFGFIKDPYYLC